MPQHVQVLVVIILKTVDSFSEDKGKDGFAQVLHRLHCCLAVVIPPAARARTCMRCMIFRPLPSVMRHPRLIPRLPLRLVPNSGAAHEDTSGDASAGEQASGAILNTLIILGTVIAMTTVLVTLFYFKWYKALGTFLVIVMAALLGLFTYLTLIQIIVGASSRGLLWRALPWYAHARGRRRRCVCVWGGGHTREYARSPPRGLLGGRPRVPLQAQPAGNVHYEARADTPCRAGALPFFPPRWRDAGNNGAFDVYSLSIIIWNYGAVGLIHLAGFGGKRVQQVYHITLCVTLSLVLQKSLPEYTLWILLAAISCWDLVAVLCPYGPLRILVETAQDREVAIPQALIYSTMLWVTMAQPGDRKAGPDPSNLLDDAGRAGSGSGNRQATNPNPSPAAYTRPATDSGAPAAQRPARPAAESVEDEGGGPKLGLGDFIFYSILIGAVCAPVCQRELPTRGRGLASGHGCGTQKRGARRWVALRRLPCSGRGGVWRHGLPTHPLLPLTLPLTSSVCVFQGCHRRRLGHHPRVLHRHRRGAYPHTLHLGHPRQGPPRSPLLYLLRPHLPLHVRVDDLADV